MTLVTTLWTPRRTRLRAGGTLWDEVRRGKLEVAEADDEDGCVEVHDSGWSAQGIDEYALAYNLVRVTMCQAAGRQGVEADRVSFIARGGGGAEEGEEMPELVVNPRRRGGTSRG